MATEVSATQIKSAVVDWEEILIRFPFREVDERSLACLVRDHRAAPGLQFWGSQRRFEVLHVTPELGLGGLYIYLLRMPCNLSRRRSQML
jgi:hypothetical protein